MDYGELTDKIREAAIAFLRSEGDLDSYLIEAISDYDSDQFEAWLASYRPEALDEIKEMEYELKELEGDM